MTAQYRKQYNKLQHAMQTGVKMMQNFEHPNEHIPDNMIEPSDSPKHLRVGVNSAMVEHAALTLLLVDKGIITMDDYERSLVDLMKREVEKYESDISKAMYEKTGKHNNFKLI